MKKVLFLGQAPARPNSKHAVPGSYLYPWLRHIGLSDVDIQNHCFFYALIDAFPGHTKAGHAVPQAAQMLAHRPFLVSEVKRIKPEIIVPVGKLAITELLQLKNVVLADVIGTKLALNPFGALNYVITCIPFSHPSGRSTWNVLYAELVIKMLELLKQELVQ